MPLRGVLVVLLVLDLVALPRLSPLEKEHRGNGAVTVCNVSPDFPAARKRLANFPRVSERNARVERTARPGVSSFARGPPVRMKTGVFAFDPDTNLLAICKSAAVYTASEAVRSLLLCSSERLAAPFCFIPAKRRSFARALHLRAPLFIAST